MMDIRSSDDWLYKTEQVIRSRHYTWLGERLGGKPIEKSRAQFGGEEHGLVQPQP